MSRARCICAIALWGVGALIACQEVNGESTHATHGGPPAASSAAPQADAHQKHSTASPGQVPAKLSMKEPVDAGSASDGAPMDSHAGHIGHVGTMGDEDGGGDTGPANDGLPMPMPQGYAPIQLEPWQVTALNLTTAPIAPRDFVRSVRTVGLVSVDETRTSHVHTKVRGWIEGISVDFVGQKVKRGQALCTVYSQEVFAAELELLGVLERASPASPGLSGSIAEIEQRAQAQVVDAAKRRLSLWDVPRGEIERLVRTREPRRTFTLSAPRSGTVVAKQALQGMYVDPSLELYLLSDLSRVWVLVDVYEADVPYVELGTTARLRFASVPGEPITAKVAFVAPTIDEATRTMKVRYELDNRDGHFRPGTFATAEMELSLGRGLAAPESAIIRTGERAIAFVVHGTHVEPREVKLGPSAEGYYRVEAGLSEGDLIATGAQFLLDSESRLRATSTPGGGHAH